VAKTKIEEHVELDLSETIRSISESMDRLLSSGLKREAIVTLLHDDTKLPKRQIMSVLDSLKELAVKYTRGSK